MINKKRISTPQVQESQHENIEFCMSIGQKGMHEVNIMELNQFIPDLKWEENNMFFTK